MTRESEHTAPSNPLPTLEGTTSAHRDGRYRLFTVAHLPFDALPAYRDGGPATVTVGPWGMSTSSLSRALSSPSVVADDDGKTTLNVYQFKNGASIKHELDGTRYDTDRDAARAAYDAGVIGFMIYERDRERLGVGFRFNQHTRPDGSPCRWSHCDVLPPELRTQPGNRRCAWDCPTSDIEVSPNIATLIDR